MQSYPLYRLHGTELDMLLQELHVWLPRKIRITHQFRALVFINTVVLVILVSFLYFEVRFKPKFVKGNLQVEDLGNLSTACRLPNIDPFHSSVISFIEDLGPLRCEGTRYSSLENGTLYVRGKGIAYVQYRSIHRPYKNDFNVSLSDPINILNTGTGKSAQGEFTGSASVETEYIRVDIFFDSGGNKSEFHVNVQPKKEVLGRLVKPGGIPLDVAMVMFDSTSAANFRRKMPKSLEYLTHNLGSVLLQGETIVGDGTTAQLCAMLTGIAEDMEPEARRDFGEAAKPVDSWNWIFKNYKEQGYATMFSEESPASASFNYRLVGFTDPPTDHYARPFWLEADKYINEFCINDQATHNISLEHLLSFFRAYKNKRKFAIGILTDISHNNLNTIGYADDDLKNFLHTLEKESFLNSSFLVIFGDHGARFTELRKTIQGKLEERLPFFSITTPKWFSVQYPDLFNCLQKNSQALTTPFDVYATLRHIVSYPEYPMGITTGQSLFQPIRAETRTCSDAGVLDHWCPCLNWEEVSIHEPPIGEIAELIVNYINDLTAKNDSLLQLCHRLALKEVRSAFRDMPTETMQRFQDSRRDERCDSCGLVLGRKSENTLVGNTLYQLQLITSPNKAFYEATVRVDRGVASLIGKISRINAYRGQSHCIEETYPLLREYCYCAGKNSGGADQN